MTARILQTVVGLAGLTALGLGLLIWLAGFDALISIHMLFGLTVAIGLLVMSSIAVATRGLRAWGIAGIIYAIIVPIFGITQFQLLIGDLHWLIQTLHLLVGIGAVVLTGILGARYIALKRGNTEPAADRQGVLR